MTDALHLTHIAIVLNLYISLMTFKTDQVFPYLSLKAHTQHGILEEFFVHRFDQ